MEYLRSPVWQSEAIKTVANETDYRFAKGRTLQSLGFPGTPFLRMQTLGSDR
jgi:hypothetical protein